MTASWVALLGALLSSNCAAMPVGLGPTTEIITQLFGFGLRLGEILFGPDCRCVRTFGFWPDVVLPKNGLCHAKFVIITNGKHSVVGQKIGQRFLMNLQVRTLGIIRRAKGNRYPREQVDFALLSSRGEA